MNNTQIHYCNYASQPYVQIACTGRNEYVWSTDSSHLPKNAYQTDDGSCYTFEKEVVTCELCKKIIANECKGT